VHRGTDGSVHYLSSSPEGSDLIFTSPAFGVAQEHFDGPVRMVKSRAGHMYEMISATESTTITPMTTGMLLHTIGGICFHCAGPDADWALPYNERHDYDLWPHCPGRSHVCCTPGVCGVASAYDTDPTGCPKNCTVNGNLHENVVQIPVQEPSSASSPGTNAQNGAFMSNGERCAERRTGAVA
jgi:hypothetical protein